MSPKKKSKSNTVRVEKRRHKNIESMRPKKKSKIEKEEAEGRLNLLHDVRLIDFYSVTVDIQSLSEVDEYCVKEHGKIFSDGDIKKAAGRLDAQDKERLQSRLNTSLWYASSRFLFNNWSLV